MPMHKLMSRGGSVEVDGDKQMGKFINNHFGLLRTRLGFGLSGDYITFVSVGHSPLICFSNL
jgi:hypothetical protein